MAIVLTCSCGKRLTARDESAGKRVKCPACQQPIVVPFPSSEPATASPAGATHKAPAAPTPSVETHAEPSHPASDSVAHAHVIHHEVSPAAKPATSDTATAIDKPSEASASAAEDVASAPVAKKSRRYQIPSPIKRLPHAVRPALKAAWRVPWFHLLSALSAVVFVLGVVAMMKPTWLITPRMQVEQARNETINGVTTTTQTTSTRRFATIGTQWILQSQSQKRVVRGGGATASLTVVPLEFSPPGTFVTDPNARRFNIPGLRYAYQGHSDGGSLLLDSRREVNLSIWWVVGITAVLPMVWIARYVIRRRKPKVSVSL